MRRTITRTVLATVAILTAAAAIVAGTSAADAAITSNASDKTSTDIVGAWRVNANGAPYVPHLFTFTSDGVVLTTNPTNVQEKPTAAHGGTNDSVGMGTWARDGKWVVGTFYQLNAYADDHTAADDLEVRFRVQVQTGKLVGDWLIVAYDARGTFDGTRLQAKAWIPA